MSASTVGILMVELQANVARLQQDMQSATGIVDTASRKMGVAAEFAKGALQGMASGLTAAAFVGFIKGSIDAADELGKLSQKVGVTVETLSALKYAGKLSDVSLDALGTGLKKLSVNMQEFADTGKGDASAALKAIGVDATDASGKLRSTDAVFADVAEQFSQMEDGAGKTALAIAIFGKSGADLIPMLNAGRDGLAEMRQEAEALGVVMTGEMAKSAETFNDNITRMQQAAGGVGVVVANGILPTLTELSKIILETNAGGSSLAEMMGGTLKTVFETVAVLVANVAYVFKATGTEIGAMAAQLVALATLDLDGFNAISEAVKADAAKARQELDDLEKRILGLDKDREREAVLAQLAANKAAYGYDPYAEPTKGAAPRGWKAGESAAKNTLAADWAARVAALEAEANSVEKLTAVEKAYAELLSNITSGKVKATAADLKSVAINVDKALALEKLIAAEKKDGDARKAIAQEAEKAAEAQAKELEALEKSAVALEEQAKNYGLSQAAIYKATVAQLENRLEVAKSIDGNEAEVEALERKIDAYKRLASAAGDIDTKKIAADAAKQAADEWKRTSDTIEQSLTDALMRGFEGGKGFAENFRDTLKNMFKTLVLQPTVKYLVQGGLSLLGFGAPGTSGAAGMPGQGGGTGGFGDLLSMGNNAYNYFTGSNNSIWGNLSNGFSSLFGGGAGSGISLGAGMAGVGAGLSFAGAGIGGAAAAGGGMAAIGGLGGGISGGLGVAGSSIGAGALGSGISAAGGGVAAGGAAAGGIMSTIGAAIPWIGLAIAVASMFSKKRGGPKFEGSQGFDLSTGAAFDDSILPGGKGYTKDDGDAFIESLMSPTLSGINQTIGKLGGTLDGAQTRFSFARDPIGDAPTRVGADLFVNGQQVYASNHDYGRSDEEFQAGLELEAKRLSLASIKAASGLAGIFTTIVDGVGDIANASSEQIDAALLHINDAATVLDYADADPFEVVRQAAEAAEGGLFGAWERQGAAIGELVQSFDGSATATATLASMTKSRYQMEIELAQQINAVLASSAAMFADSSEQMQLSTMSREEKQEYYRNQSTDLEAQLAVATDPAKINAILQKLNNIAMASWNLLDDNERKANLGQYQAYLAGVEATGRQRLDAAAATITAAHDQTDPNSLASQIATAFGDAPASLKAASLAMDATAAAMASAAASLATLAGSPASLPAEGEKSARFGATETPARASLENEAFERFMLEAGARFSAPIAERIESKTEATLERVALLLEQLSQTLNNAGAEQREAARLQLDAAAGMIAAANTPIVVAVDNRNRSEIGR